MMMFGRAAAERVDEGADERVGEGAVEPEGALESSPPPHAARAPDMAITESFKRSFRPEQGRAVAPADEVRGIMVYEPTGAGDAAT